MAEREDDPRCGNRNPEPGQDMVCGRIRGHAGYHRDTIALGPSTVRWSALGEKCNRRMEPGREASIMCTRSAGHAGKHGNQEQGVTWPRPAGQNGPEEIGGEPEEPKRKPVPSVVLSRIRLHRAETEHALAVAESRLEDQPVLTMRAKRLRLSVTLLRSELEAWTDIERYADGGS